MSGTTNATSTNPWQEALARLEPGLRTSIEAAAANQVDALALLLEEAERKKKLCLQKRWKVSVGGKQIIVRDLFEKIIAWVNEFKAIGDVASQFDPASAALPWAGVRFILQAAARDGQFFGTTVGGMERIAYLITRYAAFSKLYETCAGAGAAALQEKLRSRLMTLYARILTFLAKGITYFGQSTGTRALKALFQSNGEQDLARIFEMDGELQRMAQVIDAQNQRQVQSDVKSVQAELSTLRSFIESLSNKSSQVRYIDASAISASKLRRDQYREFLRWLSVIPHAQHHQRRLDSMLPNTAEWILNHPQYTSWKSSSSSSILLLHGIRGCGKSHLCTKVVEEFLLTKHNSALAVPIAYFYCGDGKLGRGYVEADEVMRSLTRQLAIIDQEKYEVHEQIKLEYQRRVDQADFDGFELPTLKTHECTDLILSYAVSDNPAVIIIDAVDEVERDQQNQLLEAITRLRDESCSVVKILLSSRDDGAIIACLPEATLMRVEYADNRQDIELFTKHCIHQAIKERKLLGGAVPEALQESLQRFLLAQAGEMFLWIKLQLREICKLKTKMSLEEFIKGQVKARSESLFAFYASVLEQTAETDEIAYKIATNAFSWLLCMQEPLSSEAFLHAVSASGSRRNADLTQQELLAACSDLLIHDSRLDMFRFAHSTFKDFLEQRNEFSEASANQVAALGCIQTCIDMPVELSNTDLHPDLKVEVYGAIYWADHCSASMNNDGDGCWKLGPKVEEFIFYDGVEISLPFSVWLETAGYLSEHLPESHASKLKLKAVRSSPITPFFTACIYGLTSILDALTESPDFEVNQTNALGHTGLYLSAAFGQHALVDRLLQFGADASIRCGRYGSGLHAASVKGHISVIQLLIGNGAYSLPLNVRQEALQGSLISGHEDIAMLLLQQGIAIAGQEKHDRILEVASQAGQICVVQELTKRYPQYSKNQLGTQRHVHAAIRQGHLAFLARGDFLAHLPNDAIATAALHGHREMVEKFLELGLDIEAEGRLGRPLRVAALIGNEAIARLLLGHGAKVNACEPFGDALQAAAMNGHVSITRLLIQYGANANQYGGFYGTALQAAAYRGHCTVADILLSTGADITARGLCKDAFQAAAEGGQGDMMSLLLSRGYCPLEVTLWGAGLDDDPRGWDILREHLPSTFRIAPRSAELQSEERVVCVAEVGEGLSFKDNLRWARDAPASNEKSLSKSSREENPTHRRPPENQPLIFTNSVLKNDIQMVKAMLRFRSRLNLHRKCIGEALRAASENGLIKMVQILTATEMDLQDYLPESVERAALNGHMSVLELLFRYREVWGLPRADCNVEESHAFEGGIEHFLRVAACPEPTRAVFYGSRSDQVAVVKQCLDLLPKGDRVAAQQLALQEASLHDSHEVVRSLLSLRPNDADTAVLWEALSAAATSGSKLSLELLADFTVEREPDFEFGDIFHEAVRAGNLSIVQYLYNKGLITRYPETLLMTLVEAAQNGFLEILELLASITKDLEYHQAALNQSLNVACKEGHEAVVAFMIQKGANVDGIVGNLPPLYDDGDDYSLPFQAHGCREACDIVFWPRTSLQACMQGLADYDVNMSPDSDSDQDLTDDIVQETRTEEQRTVSRYESTMKLLLNHGANINMMLTNGCQLHPLSEAASRCSAEMISTLISHGARWDQEGFYGSTALECAAHREFDSLPIFQALFAAGAEIEINIMDGVASSPVLNSLLDRFRVSGQEMTISDPSVFLSTREVVERGTVATIRAILERHPLLSTKHEGFGPILLMAAEINDLSLLHLILSRGGNHDLLGRYKNIALQAAAGSGHPDSIRILLDAGADINTRSDRYGTSLQIAVSHGNHSCVEALLDAGADPNIPSDALEKGGRPDARDINQGSALRTASVRGCIRCIRLLLDAGANPRAMEGNHETALHAAAMLGHSKVAKALIDSGADIDGHWQGQSTSSPIQLALINSHFNVATLLLTRGARIRHDSSPLRAAVASGNTLMVKRLIDAGANPGSTPFLQKPILDDAVTNDDAEMVVLLLSKGALIRVSSKSPTESFSALHQACDHGSRRVVEALLSHGADIDTFVDGPLTPLAIAARRGHFEIVLTLLESGARVFHRPHGLNVLAEACRGAQSGEILHALLGSMEGTAELSAACADALSRLVALPSDEKLTGCEAIIKRLIPTPKLLQQACQLGSLDGARWVLDHGADVNADSPNGIRPLHTAIYYGHRPLITLLLERGADASHISLKFGSVVDAALEGQLAVVGKDCNWPDEDLEKIVPDIKKISRRIYGSRRVYWGPGDGGDVEEVILQLVSSGAEVRSRRRGFGTTLQLAAYFGCLEVVRMLLDNGANVGPSSGWVESPILAAVYGKHHSVVELLLSYGADVNVKSARFGSALHHACEAGDGRMVRMLVDAGADLDLLDGDGHRPLTVLLWRSTDVSASQRDHRRILDVLFHQKERFQVRDEDIDYVLAMAGRADRRTYDEVLLRILKHCEVTSTLPATRARARDASQVLAPRYDAGSDTQSLWDSPPSTPIAF